MQASVVKGLICFEVEQLKNKSIINEITKSLTNDNAFIFEPVICFTYKLIMI